MIQTNIDKLNHSEEAILFAFDNVAIPFTQGLKLELQQPEKHPGNPVLSRGEPGSPDDLGPEFYGSIIREGDLFRLWYNAIDRDFTDDETTPRCPAYAESRDGIHWEKPDLNLVDYRGSKKNNLVKLEPYFTTSNLKVIRDDDESDPAKRYKMVAGGFWYHQGESSKETLVTFTSGDGLNWNAAFDVAPHQGMIPKDDLLVPPVHYEAASGFYKWQDMYYINGQTLRPVHTVHTSGRELTVMRSSDFINWSPTVSLGMLREGQYGEFEKGTREELHEGISVWNRGNVLLGLSGLWHGHADEKGNFDWSGVTVDLGWTLSNDGLNFRQPVNDFVFLPHGDDSQWDRGGLLQAQAFENVGDMTYMWYSCWDPRPVDYRQNPKGIGLATLPRDRFGHLSMKKDSREGSFVTSSLVADEGSTLNFNVEGLSQEAWLEVELLDRTEHPLPNYSNEQAAKITQDGFETSVLWDGIHEVCCKDPFKIRVIFKGDKRHNIRLYAMTLK